MPCGNVFSHILLSAEGVCNLTGLTVIRVVLPWLVSPLHGLQGHMGHVAVGSQRSGEHPIPKGLEGGWQHPQFLARQEMSQRVQVVFSHTPATVTIARIFS